MTAGWMRRSMPFRPSWRCIWTASNCAPANGVHGAKAPVQYRRALDSSVSLTNWSYVDHLLLPPGSSTSPHMHMEVAEFYYVMSGEGTVDGIVGRARRHRRNRSDQGDGCYPDQPGRCSLVREHGEHAFGIHDRRNFARRPQDR